MSYQEYPSYETYRENPKTGKPRNSILTESQRKFLESDGSGYTSQNKYDYRESIKDRVYNAFLDFSILFEHWDESEREEILQMALSGGESRAGIAAMIAMIYSENHFESQMQALLFQAINKAESRMGEEDINMLSSVNFSVNDLGEVQYQKAIEKFRRRDLTDMTDAETRAIVNILRKSPAFSSDDLEDLRQALVEKLEERVAEIDEAKWKSKKYKQVKHRRHRELRESED